MKSSYFFLRYGCRKREYGKEENDNNHSKFACAESSAIIDGVLGLDCTKEFCKNIISKLRDDIIGSVCKDDNLIKRFGSFLYSKYGPSQDELIRQSMRQLGRLIHQLRKMSNCQIIYLSDALEPENFNDIMKATKHLCSSENHILQLENQVPNLALKIAYALKKCVAIERGIALKKRDLRRNRSLLLFESLLDSERKKILRSRKVYAKTVKDNRMRGIDEKGRDGGGLCGDIGVRGMLSLDER